MGCKMLVKRKVVIVDYENLDSECLRPEQILVKLDRSVRASPLDLGSWAYSKREVAGAGAVRVPSDYEFPGLSVVESSYQKERVEFIRKFLDLTLVSAWRQKSFQAVYRSINACFQWSDDNGHSSLLFSAQKTRNAYFDYTVFLDSQIKLSRMRPSTATVLQTHFKRIVSIYWTKKAGDILSGIPTLFFDRGDKDLPYEKEIGQYIDVSLALSTQMSAAIIGNKPFPWVLSFGDYDAAIFPGGHKPKTPFSSNIPEVRHSTEPRLKTLDEFLAEAPKGGKSNRRNRKHRFQEAQAGLEKNNSDSRSYFRMLHAGRSMRAYLVLIQIITGATASELLSIEYDDDEYVLENDVIKKEFSSVKFRAAGKIVRYPLGKIGLDLLKQYLNLRSWVLNGESHEFLFFKLDKVRASDPWTINRFDKVFSSPYIRSLRGVYLPADAPNVAKFGRQYKSLLLHTLKIKSSVVARLLNHTESTNSSVYSNVSPDIQHNEMAAYWESVRAAANVIKVIDDSGSHEKSVAGGHCDNFENPSAVMEAPPIEPDCKIQQGCLYCQHYVCHADEADVHKLLSLKYVLSEVRIFSSDIEHAEKLFRDLSIRIEFVLDGIKSKSADHFALVVKMERRVFELGELTPFWEMRMARYEKMGVVV